MSRPTNQRWRIMRGDDAGVDTGGGIVLPYLAGAALKVGDVVFISVANTVNKSLTAADHLKLAGVVVGGTQTHGQVLQEDSEVGVFVAANTGEEVLVCVLGKCKVVCDAPVSIGLVGPATATTAGRVKNVGVTTDVAAGDTGRILGQALEVGSGAASVIPVFVALH